MTPRALSGWSLSENSRPATSASPLAAKNPDDTDCDAGDRRRTWHRPISTGEPKSVDVPAAPTTHSSWPRRRSRRSRLATSGIAALTSAAWADGTSNVGFAKNVRRVVSDADRLTLSKLRMKRPAPTSRTAQRAACTPSSDVRGGTPFTPPVVLRANRDPASSRGAGRICRSAMSTLTATTPSIIARRADSSPNARRAERWRRAALANVKRHGDSATEQREQTPRAGSQRATTPRAQDRDLAPAAQHPQEQQVHDVRQRNEQDDE